MDCKNLSFTIKQGATFRGRFRWASVPYPAIHHHGRLVHAATHAPVPESDLVPIDLTGCKARTQLRSEPTAPEMLLELSTENGRIQPLGDDGWIEFYLTDLETSALPFGDRRPFWRDAMSQLEIVHPNGDVTRPVDILWRLDPEATR